MKVLKFAAIAFAMIILTPFATAIDVTANELTIEHQWVRITPAAAKVGAGYLTIVNNGETPDHLVSITSPAAEIVEVHEMTMSEGIMRMRPLVDGLVIPAGTTVELQPGGFHIMFKKIRAPFVEGMMIPVTLHFMNAGDVEMKFHPAAKRPESEGPMEMDHSSNNDMGHDESHGDMKPVHEGDSQ